MARRHALFAMLVASPLLVATAAHADPNCNAIDVGANSDATLSAIQFCLDSVDFAYLKASTTYDVSGPVVVRSNDILTGDTGAVLRLVASTPPSSVVRVVGSGALVYHLKIDANGDLNKNGIIVRIDRETPTSAATNNNTIRDNEIVGGWVGFPIGKRTDGSAGPETVAVFCGDCSGNQILHNDMHDDYIGVVLKGNSSAYPNYAENNTIHDNECDTADLAGYAVFRDNTADNNGSGCGPAPGGGIYASTITPGAIIEGNTVTRMCGHGIDLINSMGLVVQNNSVKTPGANTRDPNHAYCRGAAALSAVNVRQSKILGNYLENLNISTNVRAGGYGTSNGFKDNTTTAADYSDVPNGGNSLFAMLMVWTGNQTWTTRSNSVNNNTFVASCGTGCLGISLYVGRGTGAYHDQTSDSGSWNFFEGNVVYGSEYRSVRWGHGWWAGNNANPANAGNPDPTVTYCDERTDRYPDACNDDDYQYNPVTGQQYPTLYRSNGKPSFTNPL